jgi:hypothetical protein
MLWFPTRSLLVNVGLRERSDVLKSYGFDAHRMLTFVDLPNASPGRDFGLHPEFRE